MHEDLIAIACRDDGRFALFQSPQEAERAEQVLGQLHKALDDGTVSGVRGSVADLQLMMADLRTLHAREVIAAARSAFGERVPVFADVVQYSVRLKEAPLATTSILEYAGDSPAAAAYRALAAVVDGGAGP